MDDPLLVASLIEYTLVRFHPVGSLGFQLRDEDLPLVNEEIQWIHLDFWIGECHPNLSCEELGPKHQETKIRANGLDLHSEIRHRG